MNAHTHEPHEFVSLGDHLNIEHGRRLNDLMAMSWDEKEALHDQDHQVNLKVWVVLRVFSGAYDEYEMESVHATKESAEAATATAHEAVVQEWMVRP